MGFFEGIFDLVGEGIDCVMDGVIAVGEFAEGIRLPHRWR